MEKPEGTIDAKAQQTYPIIKRTKTGKVTGRKTVVSKRPSVREQIESWLDASELEMAWAKKVGGKLEPAVVKNGSPEKAFIGYLLGRSINVRAKGSAWTCINKESHFMLHTHITSLEYPGLIGAGVPSPQDLIAFHSYLKNGLVRTSVIVQIGTDGRVKGYTVFKLNRKIEIKKDPPKTLKSIREKFQDAFFNKLLNFSRRFASLKDKETLASYLKELSHLGFRLRFVPMKGYFFNKRTGNFEKLKPGALARTGHASHKRRKEK